MKKNGSALVMVLVVFAALMIVGSAVSVGVVKTIQFNKKYTEDNDLELFTKSALNIGRMLFIEKVNSVSDVTNLNSSYDFISDAKIILGDGSADTSIPNIAELSVSKITENKYLIKTITKFNGIEKEETQEIAIGLDTYEGEKGNIEALTKVPLTTILKNDEGLISNGVQTNVKNVFFRYSGKGHSITTGCSHSPKINENITYNNISNQDFNCGNPSLGDSKEFVGVRLSIPELNLLNQSNSDPILNKDNRVIVRTREYGEEYQYIRGYNRDSYNYDIILSNDDIIIESNVQTNEISENTLIIVTRGEVIIKGDDFTTSNIAIVGNKITSEINNNFIPSNDILLVSMEKLSFKNGSNVDISTPIGSNFINPSTKYSTTIKIINDIIQRKTLK